MFGQQRVRGEPDCARGTNCVLWEQGVSDDLWDENGVCAECVISELRRVLDCVHVDDEERDLPLLDLLAEAMNNDELADRVVRAALKTREARKAIRELPVEIGAAALAIAGVRR